MPEMRPFTFGFDCRKQPCLTLIYCKQNREAIIREVFLILPSFARKIKNKVVDVVVVQSINRESVYHLDFRRILCFFTVIFTCVSHYSAN